MHNIRRIREFFNKVLETVRYVARETFTVDTLRTLCEGARIVLPYAGAIGITVIAIGLAGRVAKPAPVATPPLVTVVTSLVTTTVVSTRDTPPPAQVHVVKPSASQSSTARQKPAATTSNPSQGTTTELPVSTSSVPTSAQPTPTEEPKPQETQISTPIEAPPT